jgi:acyl-CoA thioesterase I
MIASSRCTILSFVLLAAACDGRASHSASGAAGRSGANAGAPATSTQGATDPAGSSRAAPSPSSAQAASPAAPQPGAPGTILFIGTSLTAGLGLDPDQAYPALIQKKIDSAGLPYRVQNAGVSGETSAGARRRIDWLFQKRPDVVVIETGANDMLRGQSPDSVAANIQAIIDHARALRPEPRIVLVGMRSLPNFGPDYAKRFVAIYPRLARENQVPLVPFLLEGVGGVDSLNQADGIHPTAAGERIVAENVWKTLKPVLERPRT